MMDFRAPVVLVGLVIAISTTGCDDTDEAANVLGTTSTTPTATTTSLPASPTSTSSAATTTTTTTATTTTSEAVVADVVTVTIESTGWRVEPGDVVVGPPGGFQLLVVNDTSEDQQIIFVSIFAGGPDDLPVVDGLVDVSRCNQIFGGEEEENPSPATFGCFGHLGEATPIEVVQVNPGETLSVDDGVPAGVHLIIDHMPGGYEEGRYAVFEVLEPPE